VGGHLKYEDNVLLVTLDGFDSITSVGGELKASGNSLLIDLAGYFGVTSVGGHFKIQNNPLLPTVAQAEALRDSIGVGNIGGNIVISGNGPG